MAASASSASPYLVAILLVIQPRSGPGARLIFHYPAEPLSGEEDPADKGESTSHNEFTSSSSSDDGSSTEEEVHSLRPGYGQKTKQRSGRGTSPSDDEDEQEHARDELYQAERQWRPTWEPLLGLGSSGLAGLLAAGRIWHKRKFELGINDLTFLGCPVFVREDGNWRKQKSRKTDQSSSSSPPSRPVDPDTLAADQVVEHVVTEDSTDAEDTKSTPKKNQLTMFNIVFVLDPPTLEHDVRVKEMYRHVAKKFARALKHEQAHSDFVWKESELIQSIKSKHMAQHSSAQTLYSELLSKSKLAASVASVYKAVSTSRIASINISPSTSVVLQIPPIESISVLPSLTDPPAPLGLWLTTFNDATRSSSDIDGSAATNAAQLSKNVTLLLKESPQRIIKEVQATGGPLAAPLTKFVSAIKPTKSFHKLAAASQISYRDIELLASHLRMWRRAVVIPPLHQRDTYIVSPNANMSMLKSACKAYSTAFPTLPGLATILGALSDTPRPWMVLIPSRDHKEAYYAILAWLMKSGWVTQLRTFAYVRVSPEVKKAVREQEKENELEKEAMEPATKPTAEESCDTNGTTDGVNDSNSITSTNTICNANYQSFNSDTSSHPPRRPSLMSRQSSDQRRQNLFSKALQDPNRASLILNPSRASPLESKWLDYITNSLLTIQYSSVELSAEQRVELRTYWLRFLKYFSGSDPLEFIPVREGLKRTLVWDLLGKMGLEFDGGVETAGAEDQISENRKILVTVRHW